MDGMFEWSPIARFNCIGFAYFKHQLISADYACRFPTPDELHQYFNRVATLDNADTIGIIGKWYEELCYVHLAVRSVDHPSLFIHRQNYYSREPVLVSPHEIIPDGSHSTSVFRFETDGTRVNLSFPEEKVFLRRK